MPTLANHRLLHLPSQHTAAQRSVGQRTVQRSSCTAVSYCLPAVLATQPAGDGDDRRCQRRVAPASASDGRPPPLSTVVFD